MGPSRSGLFYAVAANGLWGLFPLYWALLDHVAAIEVLAHRLVWSFAVVALVLTVIGRLRRVRELDRRTYGGLAVSGAVISVNWGVYIWAVSSGNVIEAALGYFITPLVTVVLAVVVVHERLRRWQWVAVGIAAVAVVVLTVDYGRLPWIALTLAASFGSYGLIKKKLRVGALESVGLETAILAPAALAFLIVLGAGGDGAFGHVDLGTDLLLVGAGIATVIPLVLFTAAATRSRLSTLGLLQYITPTLQFLLGVFVFHENVPPVRLLGFGLVWIALVVFTVDASHHRRRTLRRSRAATLAASD